MRKWILGAAAISSLVIALAFTTEQPITTGERFKQEFLYRINRIRTRGCNCGNKWYPPAQPLTWNTDLQKAAFGHARDMNDKRYFSHDSKDGRGMQTRIVTAGYKFNGYQSFAVGENIARGQQSIEEVTNAWFKSEGHCHNLMNPTFKEVGVVQYNDYWVQDFGGRVPWTPEQAKLIREGKVKVSQLDPRNQ